MKDLNFKETSEKYRNEMMKLYGAKFKMDNIKKEEPDSEIKIEYNEKIEDNKEIPEVLNEQEDEDIEKNRYLYYQEVLGNLLFRDSFDSSYHGHVRY